MRGWCMTVLVCVTVKHLLGPIYSPGYGVLFGIYAWTYDFKYHGIMA